MAGAAQRYHNFMDFDGRDEREIPGIVVPQRVWVPTTGGQPGNNPLASVRFEVGGQLGIRLRDALGQHFQGLNDPTGRPTMSTTGVRVAIRINWPCYDTWSTNMPVYDHTPNANQFGRAALAHRVASVIREFYNDMSQVDTAGSDWSHAKIPFDKLYLVELRHVSQGSWQPVLCYDAHAQ